MEAFREIYSKPAVIKVTSGIVAVSIVITVVAVVTVYLNIPSESSDVQPLAANIEAQPSKQTVTEEKQRVEQLELSEFGACEESKIADEFVFMRRNGGSVNFNRDWFEYQFGFGHKEGEFWFGLECLSSLMKISIYTLMTRMETIDNQTVQFSIPCTTIDSEKDNYRLRFPLFYPSKTSTREKGHHKFDYIGGPSQSLAEHWHATSFSTHDLDKDEDSDQNCALLHGFGFWFRNCSSLDVPGLYISQKELVWVDQVGVYYEISSIEMSLKKYVSRNEPIKSHGIFKLCYI